MAQHPGVIDAGTRALAGFLYQILASAVHGIDFYSAPSDNSVEVDALFAVEQFGQDAVAVSNQNAGASVEFIQYKYSLSPGANPIEPPELKDIIRAYFKSKLECEVRTNATFKYRLVSNRTLSVKAKGIKSAAEADSLTIDWFDKTGVSNSDKRAMVDILKQTRFESLDPTDVIERIESYASQFGMLPEEVAAGTQRLIGVLASRAASKTKRVVSIELDEALTGISAPSRLSSKEAHERMLHSIECFKDYSRVEPPLIDRRLVDEIQDAVLQHSLVIVTGGGGVGKTVAMCQTIESLSTLKLGAPFGAIAPASTLRPNWLSRELSKWRNDLLRVSISEDTSVAIRRLEVATDPDTRPAVILGIDAIDETDGRGRLTDEALSFIREFVVFEKHVQEQGSRPIVSLVLCCRSENDLRQLDRSGLGLRNSIGHLIPVGRFSDQELARIAGQNLDDALSKRIIFHLETRGVISAIETLGNSAVNARPITPEVCAALQHPIIWKCFHLIGDPHIQHQILDGDHAALALLSDRVVEWFCRKTETRQRDFLPLDTRGVLKRISQKVSTAGENGGKRSDWNHEAGIASGWSSNKCDTLFKEALSSGLVANHPGTDENWVWSHSFIYDYLCR